MDINKKDKKILLALDMDARKSDSRIAKEVGLSAQVTNYRIKQLQKKGIIKSYYPVIDHTKLGLKLYRIGIKLENATKQKEKEILDYLMLHSSWIVSALGQWNILMATYVADEFEFMRFWRAFFQKYGYYVKDQWISLMTKFWNFERSFLLPESMNRKRVIIIGKDANVTNRIDGIDKKILKELTQNARQTSLDIAKKIGQTERIVRYRISGLEKEKIVLGYRTFLNTALLNLKYYKLFIQLKNSRNEDVEQIRTFINQNPNVIYNTEALGGYDFELEVQFSDSRELFNFINHIREKFPLFIKDVHHLEYIDEYKITYFPV